MRDLDRQQEIEQILVMMTRRYWRRPNGSPLRIEVTTPDVVATKQSRWFRREDIPAYLNLIPSIVLAVVAAFALEESKRATNEMVDQVSQAQSQTKEAQRQAKAAEDQLLLYQHSQRPWIFGTNFRLNEGIINTATILPGSHGWLIRISLDYKNSGNEPAVNVSGNFFVTAQKRLGSRDFANDQSCAAASDGEAIFPGETKAVIQNVLLPDPTVGANGSGGESEYYDVLLGCITYTSAFDNSFHTTKMAYEITYVDGMPSDKKLDPSKFKFNAAFGNGNFRAD